uniref:P43 5S RNA-binding protein n=1 Tax=Oryzias melastigma TaxID=30732 RepID=A0A3B3CSK9_ORYME
MMKAEKGVGAGPQQVFSCAHAGCGASFPREWKLKQHETAHTGEVQRPCACPAPGCGRRFKRTSHLKTHMLQHKGVKGFCNQPKCSLTFKKRRLLKLHLKCSNTGCMMTFDSHIARKAHEKKHASFTCGVCKKTYNKAGALRRHKRTHASHKPVLLCPRPNCQAYFTTTFNLQHHIRKVHLQLLKYKCSFPDCPRTFAMRQESMHRHLVRHDPSGIISKKRPREKKSWQKRLNGHNQPSVEENLQRLFALRMRISRRAKVEANLAGLFNERKIPHFVDPEVNLRDLFG